MLHDGGPLGEDRITRADAGDVGDRDDIAGVDLVARDALAFDDEIVALEADDGGGIEDERGAELRACERLLGDGEHAAPRVEREAARGELEGVRVEDARIGTDLEFLGLVPSDIDLVGAEIELVAVDNRERRLKEVLALVKASYDFIIIDCPPSLGLLTLNALTAADRALVPLQCEYYSMEGLAHILRTIGLVKEKLNPGLEIEGVVLTMFDGRTSLASQVKSEVQGHLRNQVMQTIIPRNIRITEAPSHGKPIMLYDLRSPGAAAYLELTKEILAHEH